MAFCCFKIYTKFMLDITIILVVSALITFTEQSITVFGSSEGNFYSERENQQQQNQLATIVPCPNGYFIGSSGKCEQDPCPEGYFLDTTTSKCKENEQMQN